MKRVAATSMEGAWQVTRALEGLKATVPCACASGALHSPAMCGAACEPTMLPLKLAPPMERTGGRAVPCGGKKSLRTGC